MFFWRILFALFLVVLTSGTVSAATLYFDPGQESLGRGDAQIFKVRLDTDEQVDECVNAVSGVITFSGPIEPIDVSTGDSILSIWLEQPAINAEKGEVSFAGGIPNGYCGRIDGDPNLTNILFEVIVRADAAEGEEEVATISFTNETTAYLNDGFGSLAAMTLLPSRLTVAAGASDVVSDPWTDLVTADTVPPQEFSIQLAKDTRAFSGKYFITYSTTDKQSGIDHYEIMEEPVKQAASFLWGRADAPWVRTTKTTYVLEDQSLNSVIRVKAVDKAGNEYVANLLPDENLRSTSMANALMYAVYTILFAGFGILVVGFMRARAKSKKEHELTALNAHRSFESEAADLEDHDPNQNI